MMATVASAAVIGLGLGVTNDIEKTIQATAAAGATVLATAMPVKESAIKTAMADTH